MTARNGRSRITLTRGQACAAFDALRVEVASGADYQGDHDRATADYAAAVAERIERLLDEPGREP